MAKWDVEYKAYGKTKYVYDVEAKDGKEAIEYVRAHVIGAYWFKCYRVEEDNEETGC